MMLLRKASKNPMQSYQDGTGNSSRHKRRVSGNGPAEYRPQNYSQHNIKSRIFAENAPVADPYQHQRKTKYKNTPDTHLPPINSVRIRTNQMPKKIFHLLNIAISGLSTLYTY